MLPFCRVSSKLLVECLNEWTARNGVKYWYANNTFVQSVSITCYKDYCHTKNKQNTNRGKKGNITFM